MAQSPQLDVIDTIYEAWRRQDAETVLAQLHDGVEFVYALGQRPVVGTERVRRLLAHLAANQRDVAWRWVHRAQDGDVVFVEAIDDYINAAGHHVRTPFVTVYEFEGTKIRRWREYFDTRGLELVEAGEPISEWIEPLVAPERGR
ncbi:MAG: nuclear transport factor 2 family protein [Actinomycetota bacterium]